MSHCQCCCNGTCTEDDPTIVPPHSNFHPLPTRPVFSPPTAIPGVYTPWSGRDGVPPEPSAAPPEATEVQSPLHSARGSGSFAAVDAVDKIASSTPEPSGSFSLRR
jgi:hypothetical protein